MRFVFRMGADLVWIIHFLVVVLALFGWLWPQAWIAYMAVLGGTIISTMTYGYCILSKWEFELRKKVDPAITYEFSYSSYYTHRLTHGHIGARFLAWLGVMFCALSLAINVFFRFFY